MKPFSRLIGDSPRSAAQPWFSSVRRELAMLVPTRLGASSRSFPRTRRSRRSPASRTHGQTLTATQGTWTGDPTAFTYQWVRCPPTEARDGSDCAALPGASTTAIRLVCPEMLDRRIRVRVTGNDHADGVPDGRLDRDCGRGRARPVRRTLLPPTIVGSAVVGESLTANPGTWTGTGITFAYPWSRCDPSGPCLPIPTATASTYTLVTADSGRTIRVSVTATNTTGSNSEDVGADRGGHHGDGDDGLPVGNGADRRRSAHRRRPGSSVRPAANHARTR